MFVLVVGVVVVVVVALVVVGVVAVVPTRQETRCKKQERTTQDTRCGARGEEGTPDSNDKVKRGKVARSAVKGEEGTPDYGDNTMQTRMW